MSDPASTPRIHDTNRQRPHRLNLDQSIDYELTFTRRDGECLVSTRPVNSHGYRKLSYRGRVLSLPRLVLQRKLGRQVREDEDTRHMCHNRACVNPEHLETGSQSDNMQDMARAGRNFVPDNRGERCATAKLTANDVRAIRAAVADGAAQAPLGRRYGVGQDQISRIVSRKRWKHV